jgi:hypothetical protein
MQNKLTIETKAAKTESMCCRRASSSNVTRRRLLWELCVEKCYGHHRLNKHIQHSAKLPVLHVTQHKWNNRYEHRNTKDMYHTMWDNTNSPQK